MMIPDAINGTFEALGGFVIALHIRRILRDKRTAGVHWAPFAFYSAWGVWNLYYYPSLDQWASFVGGLGVVGANVVYLALMIYYMRWPGGRT